LIYVKNGVFEPLFRLQITRKPVKGSPDVVFSLVLNKPLTKKFHCGLAPRAK